MLARCLFVRGSLVRCSFVRPLFVSSLFDRSSFIYKVVGSWDRRRGGVGVVTAASQGRNLLLVHSKAKQFFLFLFSKEGSLLRLQPSPVNSCIHSLFAHPIIHLFVHFSPLGFVASVTDVVKLSI